MNDLTPILYTIKPGDTLYNLALMYGTTVQEIIDTNLALNPYDLRVGQQIYIYPYSKTSYDYWGKHKSISSFKKYGFGMA